ncbi:hypothetical protein PDIP_35490 [Penicillium digitatum Pd1]|uniref:Uncharacterized protein n=1 Tax=Penicillium digitatum (strain Pd1 / CECT 20795) TaxID=1170230 RepID=K9G522_PEND1|nr:hypothetical protein PDIP_35490 [Penicillium digitatum Pd1]EKV16499.1 hypothetical protein PDIP_35490 [Penicillium digitatum Pd1]
MVNATSGNAGASCHQLLFWIFWLILPCPLPRAVDPWRSLVLQRVRQTNPEEPAW